jgi:tricorn protease
VNTKRCGGTWPAVENRGISNSTGEWEVENVGVARDMDVEMDSQAWRAGYGPQLEKAVAVVLKELKKPDGPRPKRTAYPNYHQKRNLEKEGPEK